MHHTCILYRLLCSSQQPTYWISLYSKRNEIDFLRSNYTISTRSGYPFSILYQRSIILWLWIIHTFHFFIMSVFFSRMKNNASFAIQWQYMFSYHSPFFNFLLLFPTFVFWTSCIRYNKNKSFHWFKCLS